ncbi:hypothetical protein C2857_007389 [Epichloe festucae Fl1]|uniref:ESCRT-I component n=1 Tax=Epichloe festucae (strain Fl1) TaxID=877507 RepID=A0A7S9PUQ5_EPIFF|nr:hypothetical protein C2857_007389 [Epichloe festucae Fl1]
MPVQQHVLNWLYSVLTSEYHDVNRTYSDVAQALTNTPSLSPRTDVHTFPDGSSALLLHLTGTLPVNFRGNMYRFPISIWIPHAYPREPPLVYVIPTETIMVRPGQHVDPQGQVYHPYLVGWAQFWDVRPIAIAIAIAPGAKQADAQGKLTQGAEIKFAGLHQRTEAPPPLPPLPHETAPRQSQTPQSMASDSRQPPPPPPKEHTASQFPSNTASPSSTGTARASVPSRYDSAPPLPPQVQASPPVGRHGQHLPPPPPPHIQQQQHTPQYQLSPPGSHGVPQTGAPQHPTQWQSQRQSLPGYAASGAGMPPPPHQRHHAQPPTPAPAPAPAPPPPNILDEPLTLDIPADTAVAPPPIPPNPEKDKLLGQLARTLFVIRQRTRQQNEASMAGLQAQRNAMQQAMAGIRSESSQLTQLSNVLTSNTNILHEALRKADGLIEGSRSHPAPDIDELLVAPTVVSNQLYNLVAEERALGDAIFILGRAVERGRISPAVFAKTTRSLAREWYLKKALVRKMGQGMGMAL